MAVEHQLANAPGRLTYGSDPLWGHTRNVNLRIRKNSRLLGWTQTA